MNIIFYPSTSLFELTDHLKVVDQKTAFFGRRLCVLSEPTGVKQEIILAGMMKTFMNFIQEMEPTEVNRKGLDRFVEEYSLYVSRVLKSDLSIKTAYLLRLSKEIILSEHKHFGMNENGEKKVQLLLITDTDGDNGERGAMALRAANALGQGFSVIMPYSLLLNLMLASFKPLSARDRDHYYDSLSEGLQKISDKSKWSIYKHHEHDLVAILLKSSERGLNLLNYQQIGFSELEEATYLFAAKIPVQLEHVTSQDIIEIFSVDVEKQVIWSGHGLLKREALGLPLSDVADIFNRVKSVSLWNLDSCYLLGNMGQIMKKVVECRANILMNNGVAATTCPLEEDESLPTFFHLMGHLDGTEKKVKKMMARAAPWIGGLTIIHHPHVILRGRREILPLEYRGLSGTLDEECGEPQSFSQLERLYLSIRHVKEPISLEGKIILLPGLAERNSIHLLNEVKTSLTFEEFVETSFPKNGYLNDIPGRKEEDWFSSSHEGNVLFVIRKLECSNGCFDRWVHFATKKQRTILFFKSGEWRQYPSGKRIDYSIEEFLKQAYRDARPNVSSLVDEVSFKRQICLSLNVSEDVLKILPEEEEKEVFSSVEGVRRFSFSTSLTSLDGKFLQALVAQDHVAIPKGMKDRDIAEALIFCIKINKIKSFSYLLDNFKGNFQELFLESIKKRRPEFVKLLSSKAEIPRLALRWEITYGNLATFETTFGLMSKSSKSDIDRDDLKRQALSQNQWEIIRFLET